MFFCIYKAYHHHSNIMALQFVTFGGVNTFYQQYLLLIWLCDANHQILVLGIFAPLKPQISAPQVNIPQKVATRSGKNKMQLE